MKKTIDSVKSFKDVDEMQTAQNNYDTSLTKPSYTDSNGINELDQLLRYINM